MAPCPTPGTVDRRALARRGGAAQQGGAVAVAAEHEAGDERLHHERVERGSVAAAVVVAVTVPLAGAERRRQRDGQQRARCRRVALGADVARRGPTPSGVPPARNVVTAGAARAAGRRPASAATSACAAEVERGACRRRASAA